MVAPSHSCNSMIEPAFTLLQERDWDIVHLQQYRTEPSHYSKSVMGHRTFPTLGQRSHVSYCKAVTLLDLQSTDGVSI